jgi:hypothetical protein
MTKEREQRMMIGAKILAGTPFNELPKDELDIMLNHGNIIGGFICGVRWADKNPENPWVSVNERLPEDSLPLLTNNELGRKTMKVIVLMMDGRIMEAYRRLYCNRQWYWNIPIRMREQVTHWMPIPLVPSITNELN